MSAPTSAPRVVKNTRVPSDGRALVEAVVSAERARSRPGRDKRRGAALAHVDVEGAVRVLGPQALVGLEEEPRSPPPGCDRRTPDMRRSRPASPGWPAWSSGRCANTGRMRRPCRRTRAPPACSRRRACPRRLARPGRPRNAPFPPAVPIDSSDSFECSAWAVAGITTAATVAATASHTAPLRLT